MLNKTMEKERMKKSCEVICAFLLIMLLSSVLFRVSDNNNYK